LASSSRVFVTGATGFIGQHVVRALRDAGYEVRALVRKPDMRIEHADTVVGDLRNPGALAVSLRACRYLVHCAALYSFAPRDRSALRLVNVVGTAGLLEAARISGVERAVVTSSAATVGPARPAGTSASETDWAVNSTHSAYHHSKLEQERAALAARVPTVLVLPTSPVGPGDWKPTPTGQLIVDFAQGRVFAAPPHGGTNLVPVEDVARAHVLALERGRPGERYLVGGDNLSLDQVWALLAEATGRRVPRWRIPYALAVLMGWVDEARCRLQPRAQPRVPLEGVRMSVQRMYVDCSKARTELGYQPGPVRDALARAVAWYRAHGYA
jgi:dihydroflavonol-4-reductase